MERRRTRFDVVLAEAVNESLISICPSIPQTVFSYLKQNKSINSDNYIDDPKAFEEGLKKLFGFGSKIIEKKILEVLYQKLEAPRTFEDGFQFHEEVKTARRLLDPIDLVHEEAT